MQFEVMKKTHKKEILVGVIVFVTIAIVLIVHQSYAKYKTVKNMTIASGTINYKVPDFKIMAMYQQKANQTCTTDSCYSETTTMPSAQSYVINESKSYCTINSTKETGITLKTTNGNHIFKGLNKNSKCYLYFDNVKVSNIKELIASKELLVRDDFSKVVTEDTTGKMYMAADDDGISYYYAGAVKDNYVKFANKFWRIIRINGDGTIRLIYQGTSATSTGTAAQIGTSKFNTSYDNYVYVGFKYTSGQAQGTGTKSTILTALETWYANNLASYVSKLDTNAGFCNDREPSTSETTSNGSGGTGTTKTYYGARIRLITNKTPTFKCKNSSDLFTKTGASKGNKSLTNPIGLITADEVAMAGGLSGTTNLRYYLYTAQSYWTMSPLFCNGYAFEFFVDSTGVLNSSRVDGALGVRPVINLKADVTLTGSGTASDPYVVQ